MTETWIQTGSSTARNICPSRYQYIGQSRNRRRDAPPEKTTRGVGVGLMSKSAFTACTDDILGDNYGTVSTSWLKSEPACSCGCLASNRPPPNKRNVLIDDQLIADMDNMLTELSLLIGRLLITRRFQSPC